MDILNSIYDKDTSKEIPFGRIQWKGTDVCIDLFCKCGFHGHFDGDFFYGYICPKCNTHYAVGMIVKLIELDKMQINYMKNEISPFQTVDDIEDMVQESLNYGKLS